MQPSKRLWDSATCLCFLQDEDGAASCQATLEAARAGQVELYVSTLALAETLMIRGKDPLDRTTRLKVRSFFKSPWLITVEIDRFCGEVAQDLVWDYGIKPKDALHVAAALLARCDILETFDAGLLKRSRRVGTGPMIDAPELQILRPGMGLNAIIDFAPEAK